MRPRNLALLITVMIAFGGGGASAIPLTQIGVVDLSKIISIYFEASYSVRELNDMQSKFNSGKQKILDGIQHLERQKLDARNAGDQEKALQFDDQLSKQKKYLQEFIRIRTNQIDETRNTLLSSPTFLKEVAGAIAYVAENEGYSIVLKSDDPSIYYWNKEVDITDKVIARLRAAAKSGG